MRKEGSEESVPSRMITNLTARGDHEAARLAVHDDIFVGRKGTRT